MKRFSRLAGLLAVAAAFLASPAFAGDPPAPGESPRIDKIRERGSLRVAVLHNTPWLFENTTGVGEPWGGPAWLLAKTYAEALGVEVQPVPVSNETKVPVLAADQVDITITPLAETAQRLKVVDFVLYSSTSVCMFGLKSNPKFAAANSVDDLNSSDITIAFLIGASEEPWIKTRFPNAEHRGVISSALVPVDEVLARRADAAPINRIQWPALKRKVAELDVLPRESDCQDSTEKAQPVGMAIDKGQPVVLEWMRSVADGMLNELKAAEAAVIAELL